MNKSLLADYVRPCILNNVRYWLYKKPGWIVRPWIDELNVEKLRPGLVLYKSVRTVQCRSGSLYVS